MIDKLLHKLEPLCHSERIRYMIQLGRNWRMKGDQDAQEIIAQLEQGDFYQRYLALYSCYGSLDAQHVMRAMGDSSRTIRSLATKLAVLICDDQQICTLLDQSPLSTRTRLLKGLWKRKRFQCIDTYLEQMAAKQDPKFVEYLAFGSPSLIEKYIHIWINRTHSDLWTRIARNYPRQMVDLLQQQLQQGKFQKQWLWCIRIVLPILVEHCPEQTLSLVDALRHHVSLTQIPLTPLSKRCPNEIVKMILETEEEIPIQLGPIAHRLNPEQLLALIKKQPQTLLQSRNPVHWFRRLDPETRIQVFQACQYQWRNQDGLISPDILSLLPGELREQEARRHLRLPWIQAGDDPYLRLSYVEFLTWNEMMKEVTPHLNSPEESLRAHALSKLILSVRFQRKHLSDMLAIVKEKRYEPDPVKSEIFHSLAQLPPSIWKNTHLIELDIILRSAFDAKDLSHQTSSFIQDLLIRMIPFHPKWALEWITILMKERGTIYLTSLEQRFTDDDIHQLKPIILPILQAWRHRERDPQLLNFAESLGKRLQVFDELIDLLEDALMDITSHSIGDRILHVIQKYRPDRFRTLVPKLLEHDQSWIVFTAIHEYVHKHRQDLLTRYHYLERRYRGRFTTGKTHIIFLLDRGFQRWSTKQQELYGKLLIQVIMDSKQDLPTVQTAIRQLSQLPCLDPTFLVQLAKNAREPIRDWALQALGRLDSGQGVSTLIEALQDNRARVAIYALRQALIDMPPKQAVSILLQTPQDKVTVFKEVVRLLGDLQNDEAYQELLKIAKKPLHRDVRIALHRALWNYLEQEETWKIFSEDASSDDPHIARSICRIPADIMSSDVKTRWIQLLQSMLKHPEISVRLNVLSQWITLAQMDQLEDPGTELLPSLLRCLQSSAETEVTLSASAIYHIYKEMPSPAIGQVFKQILPNRRVLKIALDVLFEQIQWRRHWNGAQLEQTVREVVKVLASDPLTIGFRLSLIIQVLPWPEVMQECQSAVARNEITAEALITAIHTFEQLSSNRNLKGMEELELAFSSSSHEYLRRLALAALVSQAKQNGWKAKYIQRLKQYRQDSSPLVASAAQFTLPEQE
ncbi:HEAT repeat domain-containing protein [Thermoflavimicrobium dichotomicum]|uniref:HEAT repeat-containing protein n=1 Tax=Thermoflavimicrobium dichotomicum TaxID=46223 RepID=A0A1I3UE05_9BACL|nr:HEAT repeat domain-containing protein [Thermoflavimicrobium dichotomicum]SFJ80007.1 hypothetical protein SAMN05421852_1239 [Thermoflavimicrobium dichotomicum]